MEGRLGSVFLPRLSLSLTRHEQRTEADEALTEWIAPGEPSVQALAEWEADQANARHRAAEQTETA